LGARWLHFDVTEVTISHFAREPRLVPRRWWLEIARRRQTGAPNRRNHRYSCILADKQRTKSISELEIFRRIIDCLDDLKGLYATAPDDGGLSVTILA
jgi:hypothetical protein